jgi:hypothetical protein
MTVQVKNIYQRMNQVMTEVENVMKTDKKENKMYAFVKHEEVTKVLRGPMINAGILMTSSVTATSQDGNRTQANVDVSFINIDNPDDRVVIGSFGYGIDTQDKGPGKAISYAIKYAMMKNFCLESAEEEKDIELSHEQHIPSSKLKDKPKSIAKLSQEQVYTIMELVDEDIEGLERLLSFFQCKKISDIPAECYDKIIQSIERKKKLEAQPKVTPLRKEAF